MDLATLFGDRFVIDTLELTEVNIAAEALPRALKWADAEGRGKGIEIKGRAGDVCGFGYQPRDGTPATGNLQLFTALNLDKQF